MCTHEHIIIEHGANICMDCGVEIDMLSSQTFTFEMSRMHVRNHREKSILPDLESIEIEPLVKTVANEIFIHVANHTLRKINRKSIIFASVFLAYKYINQPRMCDHLFDVFQIKRRNAFKGVTYITQRLDWDVLKNHLASMNITIYNQCEMITAEHIIRQYMSLYKTLPSHIDKIISIFHRVHNKSKVIFTTQPQSLAAGIIYYFTQTEDIPFNIKEFSKKVKVSEVTIYKVFKECQHILQK